MSKQNPEQGALFEITDTVKRGLAINPELHPGTHTESTFKPSKDGVFPAPGTDSVEPSIDGPSVNILERNRQLVNVLGTLAAMSRAEGLEKANTFPSLRDPIANRYGDGYKTVLENTQEKADRDAEKVPEEFSRLWGLEEVVASGMISHIDAEDAMAEDYRLFKSWYGGSGEPAERRKHTKRWLSHQQDVYAEKKGIRRPKVTFPHHPRGWA